MRLALRTVERKNVQRHPKSYEFLGKQNQWIPGEEMSWCTDDASDRKTDRPVWVRWSPALFQLLHPGKQQNHIRHTHTQSNCCSDHYDVYSLYSYGGSSSAMDRLHLVKVRSGARLSFLGATGQIWALFLLIPILPNAFLFIFRPLALPLPLLGAHPLSPARQCGENAVSSPIRYGWSLVPKRLVVHFELKQRFCDDNYFAVVCETSC